MVRAFFFLLAITVLVPTQAGQYTEAFHQCLSDSTTGKDRTNLARWMFTGMAAHPSLADMATISPEAREATNKAAGILYTRLIAESCANEMKAAVKNEGEGSLKSSFEFLGRLAMQELVSNQNVASSFSSTEKYFDIEKIRGVMNAK